MRKFHLKQLDAQKANCDSFCKAQRKSAWMPMEVTPQQESRHRKKYKQTFDAPQSAKRSAK